MLNKRTYVQITNINSIYILVQKITQRRYGAKAQRIPLDYFIYANGIITNNYLLITIY